MNSAKEIFDSTIDILLVDDRPENLLALEAVLASPHYNLIKANSGDEALRYLLNHEPALILMDVQMPELDGFETASIVKRSNRTRDIPIIFITAINKDEHFAHEGYDHGAVDYIYKPYDAYVLKSKVAVFADLARKTKSLLQAEVQLRNTDRLERERQIAKLELKGLRREQVSQKRYRHLLEGIDHAIIWSANPDTKAVSFVSPSAKMILGYTDKDWAEDSKSIICFFERVHPGDRDRFFSALQKVQIEQTELELEHRFVSTHGQVITVHTSLRIAFEDGEGTDCQVQGLSVDITKLKDTEELLRRNKLRSDFSAEASLQLSKSLDRDTTCARLGSLIVPGLADWCAIDTVDTGGELKTISVAHINSAKSELVRAIAKRTPRIAIAPLGLANVFRTGKSELYSSISDEMIQQTAQDEEHLELLQNLNPVSAMLVPLVVRGKVLGIMTLVSSETRRRFDDGDLSAAEDLARRASMAIDNADLYEKAQAAIRARDEFLSIASHELKTPLTPLKIQIQSLMRSLRTGTNLNSERLEKMLKASERQLVRLSRLIDDLLDISKISAGKLELHPENFDLPELVSEVVERFSEQAAKASCALTLQLPDKISVKWDRFRIEQVLTNLLTNAIKYGAGQPIHVTISAVADTVTLTFRDHGIGIAEQDQKRIFQRFERAVSGQHISGLGLGLYIVAQILEAHGGTIAIQSEIGTGSTFTVTIPLEISLKKNGQSASEGSELKPAGASGGFIHGSLSK